MPFHMRLKYFYPIRPCLDASFWYVKQSVTTFGLLTLVPSLSHTGVAALAAAFPSVISKNWYFIGGESKVDH